MCVTSEIDQLMSEWAALRGTLQQGSASSDAALNPENASQRLPGQKHNAQYISRLSCMKAAIDLHLERLRKQHPHRRVCLITFADEVTIIGEGNPMTVAGDRLSSYDELLNAGRNFGLRFPSASNSADLSQRIRALQEGGATALCPALVVAIGLASKEKSRSEIILCTDGLSNVGIGSLEDEASAKVAAAMFERVGRDAATAGCTVSLISIAGGEAKLELIGKVAELTNGSVVIAKPLELVRQVRSIYQNPTIASGVKLRVFFPKGISVSSSPLKGLKSKSKGFSSFFARNNNNNSNNSEGAVSCAFDMDVGNALQTHDVALKLDVGQNVGKQVPFQVQIYFESPSAAKCVRVISGLLKVKSVCVCVCVCVRVLFCFFFLLISPKKR